MSKCRFCEGPVEINQRTGRAKLYCSKKCANKWHHKHGPKRYIKKNDDWGTRGQRDEFEKEQRALEREAKNAWIDENCISRAEAAAELGIHETTLWNRMKALGLKSHKKIIPGEKNHKSFTFIEKEHIEIIRNYKGKSYKAKAPLGFMSKADAAAYLGVTEVSIITKLRRIKDKTGKYPVRKEYSAEVVNGQPAMRCFYNIEDIKKVKQDDYPVTNTCKSCGITFESKSKRKYCKQGCAAEQKKLKREQKAKDLKLITFKEAMKKIGCSPNWQTLVKNTVKLDSHRYVKETKIQSLIWKYKEYTEKEAKEKFVRRNDNWQDWKVREEKLIKSFPGKLRHLEEKWGKDSKQVDKMLKAIDINYSYHGILETTGKTTMLTCKHCNKSQPFYEFHFNARGGSAARKTSHCRTCTAAINKSKHDSKAEKLKRKENYRSRIKISVACSIKRHIAKVTGVYCDLTTRKIWNTIKSTCGYDHNELVKHLEMQFTPNMTWYNQVTPKKPGEFGWHMDHIEPHSKFKYDSLQHPDFARCWALKNLRPLEAVMNIQKGNKKLYQIFQSSYRQGIKKAIKGEVYTRGVWKHLDYSNLEAKKILEKKFSVENGMSWDNWGEVWQLDHIEPVAKLAYTSPECKNFKKCWKLKNLQPLSAEINNSKSSRYKNKIWFHNY